MGRPDGSKDTYQRSRIPIQNKPFKKKRVPCRLCHQLMNPNSVNRHLRKCEKRVPKDALLLTINRYVGLSEEIRKSSPEPIRRSGKVVWSTTMYGHLCAIVEGRRFVKNGTSKKDDQLLFFDCAVKRKLSCPGRIWIIGETYEVVTDCIHEGNDQQSIVTVVKATEDIRVSASTSQDTASKIYMPSCEVRIPRVTIPEDMLSGQKSFAHKKTVLEGLHEEDKNEKELHKENEKPEGVENQDCKMCELSFASHKILQMHEVMVHQ